MTESGETTAVETTDSATADATETPDGAAGDVVDGAAGSAGDATDEPGGSAGAADGPDEADADTSHLDDVDDGCGCAEVWEHLSEQRGESD